MPGALKQTRAAFLMITLWTCALTTITGCPTAETVEAARCDEARRCVAGAPEVCGEDGKMYACGELARCEGVIVDASGMACLIDPPVCQPLACDLACEGGFKKDAQGCNTCACEPINCPPVAPPECQDGERTVCDAGDVCGTSCRCEQIECEVVPCNLFCADGYKKDAEGCGLCECNEPGPVCTAQPCERGTQSVCEPDRDGDGCPECTCEPLGCSDLDIVECEPGTAPLCVEEDGRSRWECEPIICPFGGITGIDTPQCDGPGGVLVCEEDESGCERCRCEMIECPPVVPPNCSEDEVVVCDEDDVCGTSCRCLSALCEPVECDLFCENGFQVGPDGCDVCTCAPSSCTDDEECGLYEACIFDFSDPEACCSGDVDCDSSLPLCVGQCERQPECLPGVMCPVGTISCAAVSRDDCCDPAALTCTDDRLTCPLLCLGMAP